MKLSSEAWTARFSRQTAGLLLLFLAAVDALGTILILRYEKGRELNPLMAWLWQHGESSFLLSKMLLTTVAVAWVLRRADTRSLRIALVVGFSIYLPLVALHLVNSLYGVPLLAS